MVKYPNRFTVKSVKKIQAKNQDLCFVWRVFDTQTKTWWNHPKNVKTFLEEAMMIAYSLNNGHIQP